MFETGGSAPAAATAEFVANAAAAVSFWGTSPGSGFQTAPGAAAPASGDDQLHWRDCHGQHSYAECQWQAGDHDLADQANHWGNRRRRGWGHHGAWPQKDSADDGNEYVPEFDGESGPSRVYKRCDDGV